MRDRPPTAEGEPGRATGRAGHRTAQVDGTTTVTGSADNRRFALYDVAVLASVITALVTTIATSYLIAPQLEARNRRIQEVHKAREQFGDSVFALITQTNRLLKIQLPREAPPQLRERIRAERTRWIARIDEVTKFLIDDTERFSLAYGPGLGIRELAAEFATHARAVWISERPLEKRLGLLHDMASHAQNIYFASWWRKRNSLAAMRDLRQLIEDAQENRR